MNKKALTLSLFTLVLLASCGGESSSESSSDPSENESSSQEVEPEGALQEIFLKISENNFTLDYEGSFATNHNVPVNQTFKYTQYAVEQDGDRGFQGVAKGNDDVVFKYEMEDGKIDSGAPLLNSSSGLRYDSIYDYVCGVEDVEIQYLPTETDDDGYYEYEFGKSDANDEIVFRVFMSFSSSNSGLPKSVKFKVTGSILEMVCLNQIYDFGESGYYEDNIYATVYNIGMTENPTVKNYIDNGGTSKKALGRKFLKVMTPYFSSENFTVDIDATKKTDQNFRMTEYFTQDALYEKNLDDVENSPVYLMSQGYLNLAYIVDGKLEIDSTPQSGSDGSFYEAILGGYVSSSFLDLSTSNLVGYEDDEEDTYIITDSQFISVCGTLVYSDVYDTNYCDQVKIVINDYENLSFTIYMDYYNYSTGVSLGQIVATFSDCGSTVIKEVDDYLSLGDDPEDQTIDDLKTVLDACRNNNYSTDIMTGAGMAKYYNTEDYFYEEVYGSANNNYGLIKLDEGGKYNAGLYEFYITDGEMYVTSSTDYSNSIFFPGVGTYLGADDDAGYFHLLNECIYDFDSYEVASVGSEFDYWNNTTSGFAKDAMTYLTMQTTYTYILPKGAGFVVKNDEDDMRISFLSDYLASDGSAEGYTSVTYYDIGSTTNEIVDAWLEDYYGTSAE